MYNGIGLQTPRGSGTNGYIQTNKFFIRPRDSKPSSEGRGFEDDQGTAGISKKPNKDILEHDRKRQIHLKLVVLEDKLIEQGYTDAEIGDKLDEARKVLEAASASDSAGGLSGDAKHSDTQTHQIAARKERQMEVLRGALGIKMSDPDPELETGELVEDRKSRAGEKREHSFLDRDYSRKKEEAIKDEKKGSKKKGKGEDAGELKHGGKRRHRGGSSESDGGAKRGRRGRVARRKGKEESEDESDSDSDDGKSRTRKKLKKSRKDISDSSASEDSGSDFYKKKIVSSRSKQRRHDSGSDDDSGSSDDDSGRKEKKRVKHRRHGSESDESESDSYSSDSSDSDSDHKKTKRKTAVKKSKSSSRRHASDDDSSSDSEPTHKTHEAKKGLKSKMRHDSDSDSDADPKVQQKLKNNQVSRGHINAVDEDPKKSRRHDSDDEDSDGPTPKDMGRQVERSKETHKGERGNPRSSLLEGRSAYNDDRRRDGHELIDRYQPEKDDEVELNYDRQRTLSKRKLDDNERPEVKPSRRSHQDDDTRGIDGEYQNMDANRDHHARPERPTRHDNKGHPERKSSQQYREDDESPGARRVDHSRSARPPKPVAKYQGRATKDENTGRESRRNDLSDAETHRSEKSNAWDEEDKKGKDIKREEVDDESKSKQRSARNGEDLKSKRYNKDEVDGRSRRSSRDEEDLPRNIRQRGREEEEGRRGRVRERSSKDEEDLPRTIRQHGREEEEGRRGRGHEGSSKDEEDLPHNSRQREEEERHGRDPEPREENKPHIRRQRGRDEEEERHDRDHPRDGQLDHFKRPRYDKRNDDRARYRD